MGVTRMRNVRRRKKKDIEKTLKLILYPPVVVGSLLFGSVKRKRRGKRK